MDFLTRVFLGFFFVRMSKVDLWGRESNLSGKYSHPPSHSDISVRPILSQIPE